MTSGISIAYDPMSTAVQADPYPFYTQLRRFAPVWYVETLDAYAVSRHADVSRVLHDHGTFSSQAMAALVTRPVELTANPNPSDEDHAFGMSIIGTDGDAHARLRLIVNRGFTPRRMAAQEREIRAIASSFVDEFVDRGGGDFQSSVAVPFPTAVIASLLGIDPDQSDDFRRWSEHMVLAVFEPDTSSRQADIERSSEQMGRWLDEVIEGRSHTLGDDMISVLLRAELEGGALSPEELRTFVFTLLVAGSITTAYLIGRTVIALVDDPALRERATRETELIGRAVEEALRFDAPVQMMFRTARAPVQVAGVDVPVGATVLPLIGSANRDESAFPDPDRFDPARNSRDHLTFGHGAHFCLGAALARLEARILIERLLARAPRLEQAGDFEQVTSLVFRGPSRLPLTIA
jgi:cytochrome P450